MLHRTIGKNGDTLSILGFGCMRLPVQNGVIDEPEAVNQIRYAIDNGVNYVDTAWPYHGGESERVLGNALTDGYREKVKIATKLPSWLIKSRPDMDRYLAAQMEKLQTDHIDYYLVHALNGTSWDNLKKLDVAGFLEAAKADGRITNTGFSFHGELADFKRIIDDFNWDFCQIQYNFLDREYQAGLEGLQYAAARNHGVIIMEPLRGGNLGLPVPPDAIKELWNKAKTSRPPAEWALRWVWNHPEVTVVLSGMNEQSHIRENLKTAATALPDSMTEQELQLIDKVSETYRQLMKVGCTGCGYCVPCPEGVSIPGCFELYNQMHMFGNEAMTRFVYALRMSGLVTGGDSGFASQCMECGECLDKCPQQIPIPDVLSQIVAELEGADLDDRVAAAQKMFIRGT